MTSEPPPLPQRIPAPWLPVLHELVLDDPMWVFRAGPERGAPEGLARLRVWRAGETSGHFAVITEKGLGLSVTTGAREIWRVLAEQYGPPLGLAEHWPHEQSPHIGVHVDLVLAPPHPGSEPEWSRLWPVHRYNPHYALFEAWWTAYGLDIIAG
jgi:hypothetical protein